MIFSPFHIALSALGRCSAAVSTHDDVGVWTIQKPRYFIGNVIFNYFNILSIIYV